MTELQRSGPAAQGVDARGIDALLDALEATPGIEPHGLVVLRHGHVVAEGWWAPYTAERPHLLYSFSKSVTSTAVGLAAAEGLLTLDDTVLSHFPELDAEVTDPRSRSMRIRDVAAMASGHRQEMVEAAHREDPADLVRGFLRLPPEQDPGTVFTYNQPCTFALAAIVQRVTGQPLTEYLRPRLFDPLGIGEVGWQRDASGREIGYSGLHAPTEAIAAVGQLYLQRGEWQGRQLLPAAYVEEATRAHISTAAEENPDWALGYGFQFWLSTHGYRGDGAYGQFCLVLPEHDAVVAMTTAATDTQAQLRAVWEHLVPAFADAALEPDEAAETALASRLAALALPAPGAALTSAPDDAAAWAGAFAPADASAPGPAPQQVLLDGGADGWTLVLAEGDVRLEAGLGTGEWVVSAPQGPDGLAVPVAVSGGWRADGALEVAVQFLETPHRLVLVLTLDGRTFTTAWATQPLHASPLWHLRSPVRG
ncbi:serine hydrolase domain-containing protein [Kineococcus rubinsiae]|uniref:serine hydrolase domain-containing protein n=1 Tax=Kineococcus rubinsiae TaxID=2609562 RepID=UPI0014305154|nr:serine hydrolase domain-containing protein [Kineococcus rubinsiae]NIZ91876.1 serine hydrolase [Kineococcus rubinsiae]